jgi:hypothetical protein
MQDGRAAAFSTMETIMQNRFRLILLAVVALAGLISRANWTIAGDGGSAHCGCAATCQICRLVPQDKRVDVVCWGCKCEDFCVPGPSKPGCRHYDAVCESCTASGDGTLPSAGPKSFVWTEWLPSSARVYTKKKLMKRTVSANIPSYKWKVEQSRNQADGECRNANMPPGTDVLPTSAADAKPQPHR